MSKLENSQSPIVSSDGGTPLSSPPLPKSFAKSQHLLGHTIAALLMRHGVARVLFVTLTFAEHVRSTQAAYDRLNSLLNAVRKRYGGYLWVLEPQASGRIHYHLLIPVDFDCHAGTHLEAWSDRFVPMENVCIRSEDPTRNGLRTRDTYQYNSMNPALQAEDDWWQVAAKAHGFGRVQVAPIYGGADAIRNYLTKADWRTRPWPFVETKNVRFWSCSQDLRVGTMKFSWNTEGARRGRQRLAAWAKGYGCESLDDLRAVLGPQWGYRYMCEVVWGLPPKDRSAPPPPATCPFPLRRYNDPDFHLPRSPGSWPLSSDTSPHKPFTLPAFAMLFPDVDPCDLNQLLSVANMKLQAAMR